MNKNEYLPRNNALQNNGIELDVNILSRFERFKVDEYQDRQQAQEENSGLECLETDIYKLYRVVLEQSNLETWDNTDDTTANSIPEENKITISCKQPLSPINYRNTPKNVSNKSLNFGQPESWSNFNGTSEEEEEVELAARPVDSLNKFSSVSASSTSPHSVEELSQDIHQVSSILSRLKITSTLDETDTELNTFEHADSLEKNNNEIKIILSPSSSFQTYEEKQEAEFAVIERKSPSLAKSPVDDLENQLQFYERIERSFFLELERNSFSLTPSSSSDPNSPNTPRKRSLTSSERKFFSSSLSTSPTPENTNTNKMSNSNSNTNTNLKVDTDNLIPDINQSETSEDLISPNTKEEERHEDVKSITNSSHDNSNIISIDSNNSSETNAINSSIHIENINISQNSYYKDENKTETATHESVNENLINFLVDDIITTANNFNFTNKSIFELNKIEKGEEEIEVEEYKFVSNKNKELDVKILMDSTIIDLQDLTNTVDHEHRKDLPRRRSMTLKNKENNENETLFNKSSLFTSLSPIEVNRGDNFEVNEPVVVSDMREKSFEKQISFKNGNFAFFNVIFFDQFETAKKIRLK